MHWQAFAFAQNRAFPRKPRKPRKLPVYLRPREIEVFWASILAPHDRALVGLMLWCGLRVSEACMLRVEHVDLDGEQLLVSQGKGGKDRYVPIPLRFMPDVRYWIGERTIGWVFPALRDRGSGHISARHVEDLVPRLAELASIPRHITPHKLRHSFASLCLARGATVVEVQDLLGHADLKTTSIYLHVMTDRLKGVVDRL